MPRHPSRELIREGLAVLCLALLYYAGARFGLLLAIDRTNSTPVWPPAGIALAGMLLLGQRAWPAVALGAFVANWVAFTENHAATTPWVIGISALIGCGNTLEALAGWWLCARWLAPGGRAALGVKDEILFGRMSVFHFAGVAFLASLASALVGPMVVCLSGIAPWKDWPLVSFTWWVGDATGILYVTPLLLGLARPTRTKWPPWKLGEGTLAFAVLLLTCWAVFFAIGAGSQAVGLKFVCMAPLVWIALRIGLMGTVVGIFVLALSAVLNTRFRIGPLVTHSEIQMLLLLLAYLWVVGVTSLTLARSVAVQQQVQASLRGANASLEAMMSAIPAMVLVAHDRDCRRITGNQRAHELLQVPLGGNLSLSAPGSERPRAFELRVNGRIVPTEELAMQKAAASGKPVLGQDLELVFSDGDVRFIFGNSVPLLGEDGTSHGSIAVFVDVTERKQAEKVMLRLNEELEARVTARTAALGQANEKLNREIAERQRLEKQILEIAEQEQRRFGQELHEGLGQELVGIGFLCNVLAEKLRGESHPEAPATAELSKLLQGSLDATRNLARTSYPVELENSGLLAALEGLADRTDGLFNIRCTVRCDWPRMFTLPDHMGIHLFRVVQEAVTNAIKHGHPQNILIECKTALGARTITVTDDGEGFGPPSGSSGMGLHLMRYRAQIVGAELTVCRAGERGCIVTCTIPTRV